MKREAVKKTIEAERFEKLGKLEPAKKNAFLYPNDPDAFFPQRRPKIGIDFRSEAIAPFETIVRSTKIFDQRIPHVSYEPLVGKVPEAPEMYLGELESSLKTIEKGMNKKQAMKID